MQNYQLKHKDGEILNDTRDQSNRRKEHFQDLLNRPTPTNPPNITPAETLLQINVSKPTKTEIRKAISGLKNGKAAGPDGVPAKSMKAEF